MEFNSPIDFFGEITVHAPTNLLDTLNVSGVSTFNSNVVNNDTVTFTSNAVF